MAEELRDTPSRREVSTLTKRLELREVGDSCASRIKCSPHQNSSYGSPHQLS
jgi:hypothetical protein